MTQTKKELVMAAFDNKPVEHVPVSFWFHFLKDEIHSDNLKNPENIQINIEGHKKYIEEFHPDFVKIMTDGFFPYPNSALRNIKSIDGLRNLQPLPEDHPWFTEQVKYAKAVIAELGEDTCTFYNLFCAATTFKFMQDENGEELLATFIREDGELVKAAFDVLSHDLARLAKKIIVDGGATGIYFSLQNLTGEGMTKAVYDEVVAPGEKYILAEVKTVSDYNILHVCGYEGHRNDLTWYADYDVKAINWAAEVEHIPLEEGKKIFGGRCVIGGFGNGTEDILYSGTKEDITQKAHDILDRAGTVGIVVGADCTVPRDTDRKHFSWVREAIGEYK